MELTEALRTNPAIRDFTDQPITDEEVVELLDLARFAPSGGNRQPWRVALVKDPTLREQLVGLCRPVWSEYAAQREAGETPFSPLHPTTVDLAAAAERTVPNPLLDDVGSIPVVLVVAVDLSAVAMMDKDAERAPITGGASVYPFAYSILLAARARGMGGVMTTFLARAEAAARPLLGLPEDHAVAAMLFLGHPRRRPTKLRRNPVGSFTTVDRFDGAPLGPT